ncbi:MAG: PIN domain-containing protein [Caulobacteraceae bacterium]
MDPTDGGKRETCVAWLKVLRRARALILSPQVLNEAYAVVVRKPAFSPARADVRAHLGDYAAWTTAPLTAATLTEGWRLQVRHRIGFWDSLLLASANAAGCAFFLSEDLNDGQTYGAVRAVDPFRHPPADVIGRALS